MKAMKVLTITCIGLTLFLAFPARSAQAQCCYFNPLFLPFAVAGAAIGTAAAIATGIVGAPYYAGPVYRGPRPHGYYRQGGRHYDHRGPYDRRGRGGRY